MKHRLFILIALFPICELSAMNPQLCFPFTSLSDSIHMANLLQQWIEQLELSPPILRQVIQEHTQTTADVEDLRSRHLLTSARDRLSRIALSDHDWVSSEGRLQKYFGNGISQLRDLDLRALIIIARALDFAVLAEAHALDLSIEENEGLAQVRARLTTLPRFEMNVAEALPQARSLGESFSHTIPAYFTNVLQRWEQQPGLAVHQEYCSYLAGVNSLLRGFLSLK